MISQVIRFTLPPPLTMEGPEFLKLRQDAAAAGASEQYFGHRIPVRPFSHPKVPKPTEEICWLIQWPNESHSSVAAGLAEIVSGSVKHFEVEFTDDQIPKLAEALEAPVSEFAFVRLLDSASPQDPEMKKWIEKGYTNSFEMDGFLGGDWANAANTDEPDGVPLTPTSSEMIPAEERRLSIYYLGWESLEARIATTETEVFAEALSHLVPYCGTGTGACSSIEKLQNLSKQGYAGLVVGTSLSRRRDFRPETLLAAAHEPPLLFKGETYSKQSMYL